jgi:hypothetical protein
LPAIAVDAVARDLPMRADRIGLRDLTSPPIQKARALNNEDRATLPEIS